LIRFKFILDKTETKNNLKSVVLYGQVITIEDKLAGINLPLHFIYLIAELTE